MPPMRNAAGRAVMQIVRAWNTDVSVGCSVNIIEDGTVAQVGGPESKKRFVMAGPVSPVSSLAFSLAGNNNDLEISVGVFQQTGTTFQPLFSLNSLPSGAQFFGSRKMRTCRSLRPGDTVIVTVNAIEGWSEISLAGEGGSRCRHNLELNNVYLGAQLRCTQTLKILPHSEQGFTTLLESQHLCLSSHDMRLCHSLSDTKYSSSSIVNCDGCPRRSIHKDALPFLHCALCHYDLCATCCLLTKGMEDYPECTPSPYECPTVSPLAIHRGSPQWSAIDKITQACCRVLDESHHETDTYQNALSLLFVCAVLRSSLGDMLDCVNRIQRQNLLLSPEVAPILAFLTGSESKCASALETATKIMSSLSALHTSFNVSNIDELRLLISIVSGEIKYLVGIANGAEDSEFDCRDHILAAALDMLSAYFVRMGNIADLSVDLIEEFRESSIVTTLMSDIKSMVEIPSKPPRDQKSANSGVQLYLSMLNTLSSPVVERMNLTLNMLERLTAGLATPLESSILYAMLNDITYTKLSQYMELRSVMTINNELKVIVLAILRCLEICNRLLSEIITNGSTDGGFQELYASLVRMVEIYSTYTFHRIYSSLSISESSIEEFTIISYIIMLTDILKVALTDFLPLVERLIPFSSSDWTNTLQKTLKNSHFSVLLPLICRTLEHCLMTKLHKRCYDEVFNSKSNNGIFHAVILTAGKLSHHLLKVEHLISNSRETYPIESRVDESSTQQDMKWNRAYSSSFLSLSETQVLFQVFKRICSHPCHRLLA